MKLPGRETQQLPMCMSAADGSNIATSVGLAPGQLMNCSFCLWAEGRRGITLFDCLLRS
jgi:hypothetical protein